MGSCLSTAKVDDNRRLATIRMLSLGKTESYSALKDHPEIKKLILKRLEFKDVDLPDCDSVELIAGISKLAKACRRWYSQAEKGRNKGDGTEAE